jgi:hypothetical protein
MILVIISIPLYKICFSFLLGFQDLMTLDFFSCSVVEPDHEKISRNILEKFREILRYHCTKFHEMLFYEISRNILAKFHEIIGMKFREINFNFAKISYFTK